MEDNFYLTYPESTFMDKTYTITLEDGTTITDLKLNGNNFVSKDVITPEIFDGNLGTVTISDGEVTETHENMELAGISVYDGEYYFVLLDIPESEIRNQKLRSDVDYIAMMVDVSI